MNVIIVGAGGRMGKELVRLCEEATDVKVIAAVDPAGKGTHKKVSDIKTSAKGVLIDFSSPEGMREALAWSVKKGWGFVSGTTGIGEKDQKEIKAASSKTAVLWASNMSVGVAVLRKLIAELSPLSDEFDFQIEEFHHRHKKDSPSGTAKTLQEDLKKAVGKKLPDVVAVRGGGIFGVHNVWAMSEEEVIRLEHTALNRAVFAKGALRAARFLDKKRIGSFNFVQVIFGE
jgi:4-hydroxy-tetrahydrodipicolinate reductase